MKNKLLLLSTIMTIQSPSYALHTRGDGHDFNKGDTITHSIGRVIMGGMSCSASFLTKRTILTAAHCVTHAESDEEIIVQTYNGSKVNESYRIPIAKSLHDIHPLYDVEKEETDVVSNIPYDLAVLTLKDDIKEAKPVILYPELKSQLDPQDYLISNGYENLTLAGNGTRKRFFLRFITRQIDLLKGRTRKAQAKFLDLNSHGYFEFEVEGKNKVCKGDSGGPAYLKTANNDLIQLGVASVVNIQSSVLGTDNCGKFAYYTPVLNDNLEWVLQTKIDQENSI